MKGFIEVTEVQPQFGDPTYAKHLIEINSIKLVSPSNRTTYGAKTEVVVRCHYVDMFGHHFDERTLNVLEEYEPLVNEIKKHQSQ